MTTIINEKKIDFNRERPSVLLVGLPGVGFVGRIAVRYLIKEGKGKKFAELTSGHFPAQVLMTNKGKIKNIKLSFYHIKTKGVKDIIALIGDVQPATNEGQYEVALEILNFIKKYNVDEIITIGGYATGKFDNKNVMGAANNKAHIEEFSKYGVLFGKKESSILGLAGLLPGLSKYHNIYSMCLMGETQGVFADAVAAKKVLEVLSKYLGIEIDYKKLDKSVKESEKVIESIQKEIEKSSQDLNRPSYIR